MKKDVLFLQQFFYPEYVTSAVLAFDTAKYLAAHGLSTDALCGCPREYNAGEKSPKYEIVEGIGIRRINYLVLNRKQKFSRLINYFSFTASVFCHIGMMKNYKCVVVYSSPPVLPIVPILAHRLFGTKFVFVGHDIYPEIAYASGTLTPNSIVARVMKRINHYLYKNAEAVVSLTDEMKDFLCENRAETDDSRITTIANWAPEINAEANTEAYQKFGYREGQFIVSYFGNLGICQDVETMIDAASAMKDDDSVKFLIVGHGSKKADVRKRVEQNGLTNVQIIDFLTGEDFAQAAAISSCCIVSLENGLKGTCAPSKYYCYLQGGKPVLAIVEKDSYLAREVETEKIGYTAEVGEKEALCAAVRKLAAEPELRAEMGERAKKLYNREYSMEIALSKYEKLIRSVIEAQ